MEEILSYLKECGTFYLATIDQDKPRVRPFGAVTEFEGRLYFVTNNKKSVYRQLISNRNIEISGMKDNTWLRLEATAVHDDRKSARDKMLNDNPGLNNLYSADDGIMEVFYLKDATAIVNSFTQAPRTIKF